MAADCAALHFENKWFVKVGFGGSSESKGPTKAHFQNKDRFDATVKMCTSLLFWIIIGICIGILIKVLKSV